MKMTKQEQRKVTQDMLRILTLWRKRQVFVDIEQTLRLLIIEGQGRKRVTDTSSLPCSGNWN